MGLASAQRCKAQSAGCRGKSVGRRAVVVCCSLFFFGYAFLPICSHSFHLLFYSSRKGLEPINNIISLSKLLSRLMYLYICTFLRISERKLFFYVIGFYLSLVELSKIVDS